MHMSTRYHHFIKRFRRLPTPLLTMLVASRFVFGVGLGALMVGLLPRCRWKVFSSALIAAGTALAMPGAMRVLRGR